MAEVTPLFGDISSAPDPVASVVAALEEKLACAKRGEIRAIAIAEVDGGDALAWRVVNGSAGLSRLIAVTSIMLHRMQQSWLEE